MTQYVKGNFVLDNSIVSKHLTFLVKYSILIKTYAFPDKGLERRYFNGILVI